MKKYTKTVLAVIATAAISSSALAEEKTMGMGKMEDMMRVIMNMAPKEIMQKIQDRVSEEKKSQTPQVLEVNGQGQVRLRGMVTMVASSSVSIKTWGGVWTILPGVNPEFISSDKSLASFALGDYVGVQGTIVPDTNLTIQGNIIRNRSWREDKRDEKKDMKMEKRDDHMMGTSTASGTPMRMEGKPGMMMEGMKDMMKKMMGGREVTPPPTKPEPVTSTNR